eukprot:CAMPEP_0197677710 /NCGR_PEP_ID=MMETSP1338-20131121/88859_1 /TAXON_ID=43686 ORGANISM="Pelagodinium beii, Strain RCC1491" /NCGR_SAMPLE_ID=MMETSP1338 /ASSEMBLY_ACC=CAM_ASM_000754 /LENGTH=53 /DNA_ID=CAMNT_0043258565 /DNA_START=514 /DNA_END=672 /DNA_ORIENTATION=-
MEGARSEWSKHTVQHRRSARSSNIVHIDFDWHSMVSISSVTIAYESVKAICSS